MTSDGAGLGLRAGGDNGLPCKMCVAFMQRAGTVRTAHVRAGFLTSLTMSPITYVRGAPRMGSIALRPHGGCGREREHMRVCCARCVRGDPVHVSPAHLPPAQSAQGAQHAPSDDAGPGQAGCRTHGCGFHLHPVAVKPLPPQARLARPTWRWSLPVCVAPPRQSHPDSLGHHPGHKPKTRVACHLHPARSDSARQERGLAGHEGNRHQRGG